MVKSALSGIPLMSLDAIKPSPRNNRIHTDDSVGKLAMLIREFGFDQPIVVDGNHEIIKGHRRYRAAQLLGLTEIPVIVRNDLSPEQVTAARIADNAVSTDSEYDYQAIALDLQDLQLADYDLLLTGLPNPEEILGILDAVDGAAPDDRKPRKNTMGEKAKTVKAVLYTHQIAEFEKALRATGLKNRGEALDVICQFYLDNSIPKQAVALIAPSFQSGAENAHERF
jgi:hypothetical protein